MHVCLSCGRYTERPADDLPTGDEVCSHEWEDLPDATAVIAAIGWRSSQESTIDELRNERNAIRAERDAIVARNIKLFDALTAMLATIPPDPVVVRKARAVLSGEAK